MGRAARGSGLGATDAGSDVTVAVDARPVAAPVAELEPRTEAAPKAIVFDVYGTLLDISALTDRVASGLGPVDPAGFLALWRRKQLEYSWLHSLMDRYIDFWQVTHAALRHAARHHDVALDRAAEQRLMQVWLELPAYPEVAGALAGLDGTPLAILSNGSPRMLEEGLAADLRARFSELLSADSVREYKPSPRVYRLATERLGLPPAGILFVSSNQWDIAGAAAFGFRVAWIDRAGVAREELPGVPDMVISDLSALARALHP